MQPPPKGDPSFSILGPGSGYVLSPDFSVYGWGPQDLTSVDAWVGTLKVTAGLQPHPEANAVNFESIYTGVASGSYGVYATSNKGRTPATTIPVTVDANPGVGFSGESAQMTQGAGGPQTNPWDRFYVAGTYDTTRITKVVIYLTRRGISFWLGGRGNQRNEKEATLIPSDGKWTCNLGFMSETDKGNGFNAHFVATRNDGKFVHGSMRSFFNGPT